MLSRRELAAGIGGAVLAPFAPSAAWAATVFDDLQRATNARSKEGRYLAAWPAMAADTSPEGRDVRQQWAALLGDEAVALADAGRPGGAFDLEGARAEDAIAAIVRASAGRRVVMLNEAHVASRHRLFLARVCRALRAEGFTHLAAETFQNNDWAGPPRVETLKAGAALSPDQGYYIADPVFAEAMREALALGYQLAAYEERQDQTLAGESPEAAVPRREQAQAENLAKLLQRWPQGRFLVHVGYGHLSKLVGRDGGSLMGARFVALTGIEPMTINQSATGSFGPHAPNSEVATAVLARFRPKDAIAVFDAKGEALISKALACDLTVFHPSRPDVEGRPGWLAGAEGRRRVAVRLPRPAPGGYVLAQALHLADPDPAIPADQYLLAEGAREAVFHLRPGAYRVRLETPQGFMAVGETQA